MVHRILVVEGNVREAQERHRAEYGLTPSQSYAQVISFLAPGVECDIACPADLGSELPGEASLSGYAGFVLTGSALHAYHDTPEVTRQVAFMRRIFATGRPSFGSCWGLQIAAVAAGGVVAPNPKGREIGFARGLSKTAAGAAHPMLQGRRHAFEAPTVHLDAVVSLPPDADVLASNARTDVQAAEIRHEGGVFWGVQYHPEFNLAELAAILARYRDPLLAERFFLSEADHARYVGDLVALHADPGRIDIAWRLGIDTEVLSAERRLNEVANYLTLTGCAVG